VDFDAFAAALDAAAAAAAAAACLKIIGPDGLAPARNDSGGCGGGGGGGGGGGRDADGAPVVTSASSGAMVISSSAFAVVVAAPDSESGAPAARLATMSSTRVNTELSKPCAGAGGLKSSVYSSVYVCGDVRSSLRLSRMSKTIGSRGRRGGSGRMLPMVIARFVASSASSNNGAVATNCFFRPSATSKMESATPAFVFAVTQSSRPFSSRASVSASAIEPTIGSSMLTSVSSSAACAATSAAASAAHSTGAGCSR